MVRRYGGSNSYRIEGDAAYLFLLDRQSNKVAEAVIDKEDLDKVILFGSWHRQRVKRRDGRTLTYVASYIRKGSPLYEKRDQRMYLHRLVMDAAPDVEIDHWNGDGLNCRKENLRLATPSENGLNSFWHRKIAYLEAEIVRLKALVGE